ncbi:MAG: hypothetical protein GX843_08475 [Synergistaceae bacterium]|nr:hypothetical protein [Synergistaceae bacterium]
MSILPETARVRRMEAKTPPPMRRVLHDCEKRSLSLEAQGIVYKHLAMGKVPLEIIERAIQEAVSLCGLKHSSVDGPLFEAIVDAVMDDITFEIPVSPLEMAYPSSSWIC